MGDTSPFALSATVYSDVLIDKGNVSMEIGPGGSLNGKVGDKFLVPIGRRAFINCDLEDAGGFPNDSSANPPLPGSVQWFKDGQLVDLRLFDSSHGNQLCVDARTANDSGNYECRVTSRIVNERFGDYTIFQTDSATSMVMVLCKWIEWLCPICVHIHTRTCTPVCPVLHVYLCKYMNPARLTSFYIVCMVMNMCANLCPVVGVAHISLKAST